MTKPKPRRELAIGEGAKQPEPDAHPDSFLWIIQRARQVCSPIGSERRSDCLSAAEKFRTKLELINAPPGLKHYIEGCYNPWCVLWHHLERVCAMRASDG